MPFTDNGALYESVFDALRDNRDSWEGALTVAACDEAVSNISGIDLETYRALVAELRGQHVGNEEQVLHQLRLSALAWPAADYGLTGQEWQGYFVTETAGGQQLYATDRYATATEWAELEVAAESLAMTYDEQTGLLYDDQGYYLPDGKTPVTLDGTDPASSRDAAGNLYHRGVLRDGAATVANLRESHFDTQTQRWRRWSDDGAQFEYYHNEDGAWERLNGTDLWHRYHSEEHGWQPYNSGTGQWNDPRLNQVGAEPGVAAGQRVEPAVFTTAEEAKAGAALVTGLVQESLNRAMTALPSEVLDALSAQELEDLAVEAAIAVAR
jgi:hypothetical protein